MLRPRGMLSFPDTLRRHGLELRRTHPRVLQINVGKLCNQTCLHCHVGAGPGRREIMTRETADRIIEWMERYPPPTVDLTGGAPELCPEFRRLAVAARGVGAVVMVRCNLTVLFEPGQEDLAEFYREHRLDLVASLPCYQQDNVDLQRGEGVFEKSIRALRIFNGLGYGKGNGLSLTLVYNPVGATLPPEQDALEKAYKKELRRNYGIEFDRLLCITNIPITRFYTFLEKTGRLDEYRRLLAENFNPATVDGLMCRDTINIGWEGELYDCDFNQMIGLDLGRHLWDIGPADLDGDAIRTGAHCFGCTAGDGSSCGGALA